LKLQNSHFTRITLSAQYIPAKSDITAGVHFFEKRAGISFSVKVVSSDKTNCFYSFEKIIRKKSVKNIATLQYHPEKQKISDR